LIAIHNFIGEVTSLKK